MSDLSVLTFRYTYVYAAINIFCVFIAVFILSKFNSYVGSNREIRLFRAMSCAYLCYLVLEIVWVLAAADAIPLSDLATGLIKVLDTMFIPFMVYFWFWFAEVRFQSKSVNSPLLRILLSLPLILMVVLYLTSFFSGIVFKITPQHTVEPGPLIALTGMVDNFYGIAIILHAAILYLKKKNSHLQKDYLVQVLFIVICTVSGILDAVIAATPVMTLAIAFAFVYLFVNLLEPQIHKVYSDALTGLSNRRRADQYLVEAAEGASPDNPFYLFIADVNHFKRINDTLGHLEGDRALRAVADAIVSVADTFHGFVARWGGDEFLVVIGHANEENFPSQFAAALDERLAYYTTWYSIPCSLAVTLGHSICDSSEDDIPSLIETADRMLYQNRRANLAEYTS